MPKSTTTGASGQPAAVLGSHDLDIAQIDATLMSLARLSRSVSDRMALLAVRGIATHVRAALPEATQVRLTPSGDEAFMEPAGFLASSEEEIGFTADGAAVGGRDLAEQLAQLETVITGYCYYLDATNRDTWSPYTTDEMPDGTLLDNGERRLLIDQALFADEKGSGLAPAADRDTMPTEVDGMQVMSAFRQLPSYGSLACTWTVILRESLDPAGNRYRLCRVRRAGAEGQWEVIEAEPGAGSLSWTSAALWFGRVVRIDATPDDGPLQEDRHLPREI